MKNVTDLILKLTGICKLNEDSIRQEFDLSPAEYNGLTSINPGEQITCKVLAEKMGLSASRGSRIIFRLVNDGYLKQEASPDDRRCQIVSLDKNGLRVRKEIDRLKNKCEERITRAVSPEVLKDIIHNLEVLNKVLS
ncbi:MAG: MarR family winged helix-turn-helix transcriptional regulator [Ignavibacteriales bacterium]